MSGRCARAPHIKLLLKRRGALIVRVLSALVVGLERKKDNSNNKKSSVKSDTIRREEGARACALRG